MTHLWTTGFQVVNFLLLLFLLHRYLWKPIQATIEQRRKEIDEASAGMKARAQAAEESRAAYDAKALAVDRERARLLAAAAEALAADRDKVLAEARAAADAERRAAREELAEERSLAAKELTDATLEVALTIARKLLGEARGPAITGAFLNRIYQHIDALPAGEMASLCAAIGENPVIRVATAPALDEAAKQAIRARLAAYFGAAASVDFVADDALIAGAELRFAHARLGYSFQHGLAAARRELTAHGETSRDPPELTAHEEALDP